MSFFLEEHDLAYGADYSYRQERFNVTGTKLPGYDYEMYDGTDEADPFRVESTREMRDKAQRNDLLPPGHMRESLREAAAAEAEADSISNHTVVPEAPKPVVAAGRYVPPQRRSRGRNVAARKLDLHALITDVSLQRKYRISPMQVAELRAMREEDPALAVAAAREMFDVNGFEHTEVTSGTVTQFTRAEAVNELAYLAATEGVDSCLADAKVLSTARGGDMIHFLSSPYTRDCEYEHEWEVICPIAKAKSGLDYYRLLVKLGYDECFLRAGVAAATLGISVVHNTARPVLHHPTVEYHAAGPDVDVDFDMAAFELIDPTERGLSSTVAAIRPVTSGQRHIAYTVAVAGSGRLLNEHVRVKGCSTKFAGKELRKFQTFRLSGELWFFYDTTNAALLPGAKPVARTRAPTKDEKVRLLVPWPGDASKCFLGPIGVMNPGYNRTWSVDAGGNDYAQPGMSGLPWIAEKDGALVAIHDGITMGRVRVLAIPDNVSCDMVVEQAACRSLSFTCAEAKNLAQVDLDALKTKKQFRVRLGAVTEALDNDGDRTLLSCYGKRLYVGGHSGEVKVPGFEYGFVATGAPGRASDLPLRAPLPSDRVLIVGRSTAGIYCSPVLSVGEVVGESMFAIELGGDLGCPTTDFLSGAVVLSIDDASVIGFVTTKGMSQFGVAKHAVMCWACSDAAVIASMAKVVTTEEPDSSESASDKVSSGMFSFASDASSVRRGPVCIQDIRVQLLAMFPGIGFDEPAIFTNAELDEVFTHPSLNAYSVDSKKTFAANRYWARMGDSALTYLAMREMMMAGVPDTDATVRKAAVQNNARQAEVALALGLDKLYMYRVGSNLSSHNLADLLEAIMGLVVEKKGLTSGEVKNFFGFLKMSCL